MWDDFLKKEKRKDYYKKINSSLKEEYQNYIVYPDKSKIYNAFSLTDFDKLKVVILGQDPYHNEGQANGLAFSVNRGCKITPTLRNIFKEIKSEFGKEPIDGDLSYLSEQGVLLLNTTLTVRKGEPNSHSKLGWGILTSNTIKYISDNKENIVFLLWGNVAKSKKKLIDLNKHCVLEAIHPSPSVNGFVGCNHFKLANDYLKLNGIDPIIWS